MTRPFSDPRRKGRKPKRLNTFNPVDENVLQQLRDDAEHTVAKAFRTGYNIESQRLLKSLWETYRLPYQYEMGRLYVRVWNCALIHEYERQMPGNISTLALLEKLSRDDVKTFMLGVEDGFINPYMISRDVKTIRDRYRQIRRREEMGDPPSKQDASPRTIQPNTLHHGDAWRL